MPNSYPPETDTRAIIDALLEKASHTDYTLLPRELPEYEAIVRIHLDIIFPLIERLKALAPARDDDTEINDPSAVFLCCIHLLEIAFIHTRYLSEENQSTGRRLLRKVVNYIVESIANDPAHTVWTFVMRAFYESKLPMEESLKMAYQQHIESVVSSQKEAPIEPGDESAALDSMLKRIVELNGNISVFELYDILLGQSQALASPQQLSLIYNLAKADSELSRDVAVLMHLHPDANTRRHVAKTVMDGLQASTGSKLLSPVSLRRLITLRNWLAKDTRADIDALIRSQRKQGLSPAPIPNSNVIKSMASEMDGAMVQCIVLGTNHKQDDDQYRYRAAGVLLKASAGIWDPWISDNMDYDQYEEFVTGSIATAFRELAWRPVTLDYVRLMINHYLQIGIDQQRAPNQQLLALTETTGCVHDWRAEPMDFDDELAKLEQLLSPQESSENAISDSLRRSECWHKKETFAASWFESGDEINRIINRFSRFSHGKRVGRYSEMMDAVFDEVLDKTRVRWFQHFLLMALWAQNQAQRGDNLWKDFLVIAQQIRSGRDLRSLPIMRNICEASIDASMTNMDLLGSNSTAC